MKKPRKAAKSVWIKYPNIPHKNAYVDIARNKYHKDFKSIWRITDLYKPNIEKIGMPIIGAASISLIVSSLGKYQISLGKIFCYKYLNSFPEAKKRNFYEIAQKAMNGLNENDVILTSKTLKSPGFFEKFFDFFN